MYRSDSKSRGFTLIELMVVVAILAILSTLLIVGISKLQTNAKRQQTAQLLENCRAMWAEYDSVKRLHIDPFVTYCPTLVSSAQSNGANADGADRFGLETFMTQSMFSLMRSQPNIKAATDKYSAGKLLIPSTFSPNPFVTMNVAGFVPNTSYYTNPNIPTQPGGIQPPGQSQPAFCSYQDPSTLISEVYLCIHTTLDINTGLPIYPPSPPDSGYWIPVAGVNVNNNTINNDTTTPVFLDAWGNPIICVIGGQLGTGAALSNGQPIPYGALVVNGNYSGGNVTNAGQAQSIQIRSPDQRLFFASAGPDGNFSLGDDNIYSFQK